MGEKREQERKYVNQITGEERVITYVVDMGEVEEICKARWGVITPEGMDNELCNVSYYAGGEAWGEIVEKEGLDEWDWEWEMV